jgi:hypothetical protein
MKKSIVLLASLLVVLSSCGSYEASGAYTGATFGSMIGSAVGGITGGWRGSQWGELAGMAGGAVVGAAIGKAADNKANQRYEAVASGRNRSARPDDAYSRSAESNGSVDDRVFLDEPSVPATRFVPANAQLEIRNARVLDFDKDGVLHRGEEARVVFELFNASDQPAFRVLPMVSETTGNKHIHISDNVYVECIQPHQGIRYTAMVKADNGLKDGQALFRVSVMQGGRELVSQAVEIPLALRKR